VYFFFLLSFLLLQFCRNKKIFLLLQQSCDKVALIPKINRRIFLIMSGGLLLPAVHRVFAKEKNETMNNRYDAIIVGGSFAGLAAAMTLGRSLRKVLVLDTDKPCNRFTCT
jgi:hypothetical protein